MDGEEGQERPLTVVIVTLDFYLAKPGPGDPTTSICTGGALRQVPVVRVFGHTPTGQSACVHVHGVFPFFYIQVPPGRSDAEGEGFLGLLAEGLEKAMHLHQSASGLGRPGAVYVYDIRRVVGWTSIYGHGGTGDFLQIWATLPQHASVMAHLLQQGAVMSTSFQPFEVHLPYLLHFLDSFGLGGMRELAVNGRTAASRGRPREVDFPYHPTWKAQLGRGGAKRLLRGQGTPWWSDPRRPQSVHPKVSSCDVEVDCRAADLLAPAAATASASASAETCGGRSVQERTRGWICETLRELWRDEERRCAALGLTVPWGSEPAPEPGAPGDGRAELTPDIMEECMMQQLMAQGRSAVGIQTSSPSPAKRAQVDNGVWSQECEASREKVSPKFLEAVQGLEVALSQRLPPPANSATAALLDGGYDLCEEAEEDALTEPDSACGSTEIDEDADAPGNNGNDVCAPTQLDISTTQVDVLPEGWSPLKPADLFPDLNERQVEEPAGAGNEGRTGDVPQGEPLPPAKGFYSEPEDLPKELVLEQAGIWEYWQAPPKYEVSQQCLPKSGEEEEGDVITRFDNAGRLTTLRRKNTEGPGLAKIRRASLSQVTPPTPAPVRPLRQAAEAPVLFGRLLVLEVLELPTELQSASEIGAVAYCLRDEWVRSLLADSAGEASYEDALGVICKAPAPQLGAHVSVQEMDSELAIFEAVVDLVRATDPAVVMGYDIVKGALGVLFARAKALGLRGFPQRLARVEGHSGPSEAPVLASQAVPGSPSADRGPRKLYPPEQVSGGMDLPGRLVLNVWRVLRGEAKLQSSSLQTAMQVLLGETLPLLPSAAMAKRWATPASRTEACEVLLCRTGCSLRLLDSLNVLPRAAEAARMLGLDVLSVLSRGSQYRVEGLLSRAAHQDCMLLLSPSRAQVASQRGAECIPLVMEPRSGFYFDPVVVLDFQSLYPSIIIAYNLCFSTCVGRLQSHAQGISKLGVLEAYEQPNCRAEDLSVTPNEAIFLKRSKKPGILPRMLYEILQTRIMVKKALKQLKGESSEARARLLDARQFGLKMIANVTYGYTGASFSGRMPCVDLADAIVQTARRTLERAVRWVEREIPAAEVLYGDTDSMFVRLPGRSKEQAFEIGAHIAKQVTSHNPRPVELQMDKVYWPCCLASKKRYVGHAWSSPTDAAPVFDAKGIETVRRDQCAATQHLLRGALEDFFESRGDLSRLKRFLRRHVDRIREGRFTVQDFIFHHEVRPPDEYRGQGPLAAQAVRRSGMSWPSPGERFSFVVAQGPPGSRLADVAVVPGDVTGGRPVAAEVHPPLYLDIEYYLERQVGPALHRLFMLVRGPNGQQGYVDVRMWRRWHLWAPSSEPSQKAARPADSGWRQALSFALPAGKKQYLGCWRPWAGASTGSADCRAAGKCASAAPVRPPWRRTVATSTARTSSERSMRSCS
ncbi:unnamed protein product [Effrenium voratum]|nr:unnamed protein product [Effrenium voratum]